MLCIGKYVEIFTSPLYLIGVNSRGLGMAYYYDNGYVPVPSKDHDNSSLGVPFSNDNDYSDATKMGFGDHPSTYTVAYKDAYISQSPQTAQAWVKFTLSESQSFTDRCRKNQRLYEDVRLRHTRSLSSSKNGNSRTGYRFRRKKKIFKHPRIFDRFSCGSP